MERHGTQWVMLVALCTGATVADAQRRPTTLEQVQVTATRAPQKTREVPASVSVVTDADYHGNTLGVALAEKLPAVPGVLARTRQNYAQDEQLSIRGFGTRASFGIRGVRLYVDGVPATMPDGQSQLSHFPLADGERVEILRGPFSTLYGNAAGGVVQLFTVDGTEPRETGVDVAGGSFGNRRTHARLRDAAGRWDYVLGLNHFATDGYRDHSRAERTLFNGKVNGDFGATHLSVMANALAAPDAQDPLGLDRAQFADDPRQATAGAHDFDTRKSVSQQQLAAVLAHDAANGAQWRALLYGGDRHVTQFLAIPVAAQANPLSGGGVIDLQAPYTGVDARWTSATMGRQRPLEWVVGLDFEQQRQDRQGFENFIGTRRGVRGALRLNQIDRVESFDQYAQVRWQPTPAWSVLAGVRHSAVAFRSRDRYITAANPDDSGRVRYRATSPVLGVSWQASSASQLYAAYGHGFETPTFNELGYRADGGSGLNFALRPARTRSGEAGWKYAHNGVASELAWFRADTRDELAVNTSSGGRTTFQNAGDARRRGVEWSAQLEFAARWHAQIAMTYLDARYRDAFLTCVTTPCAAASTPVPAGARIPGVPRTHAYAALLWGDTRGWQARLEGEHVGDVPVNNRDDERAPAYTTWDLSMGYGFRSNRGDGRAFMAVDNLFDRRYAGSVIVNEGNRRYYEPAPGRSVTVGFEWRWRAVDVTP